MFPFPFVHSFFTITVELLFVLMTAMNLINPQQQLQQNKDKHVNDKGYPSGKSLIVYHTNWACYDRKFNVKDIPIHAISDINYAFLDLKKDPNGHYVPTISGLL